MILQKNRVILTSPLIPKPPNIYFRKLSVSAWNHANGTQRNGNGKRGVRGRPEISDDTLSAALQKILRDSAHGQCHSKLGIPVSADPTKKRYIVHAGLRRYSDGWSMDVRSQLWKKLEVLGWKRSSRECLATRSREGPSKPVHTLYSAFLLPLALAQLDPCTWPREISPRYTRVLWRDLYAQCNSRVDVGTRNVAISCRSFLLLAPTRTVPSLGSAARKDHRGPGPKERHAIAMVDWPMAFFWRCSRRADRLASRRGVEQQRGRGALLRIYCVSIFSGQMVRFNTFIVAIRCFRGTSIEWGGSMEKGKKRRKGRCFDERVSPI